MTAFGFVTGSIVAWRVREVDVGLIDESNASVCLRADGAGRIQPTHVEVHHPEIAVRAVGAVDDEGAVL